MVSIYFVLGGRAISHLSSGCFGILISSNSVGLLDEEVLTDRLRLVTNKASRPVPLLLYLLGTAVLILVLPFSLPNTSRV